MASLALWFCALMALAPCGRAIVMPTHLFSPDGATIRGNVNFTGPVVFSAFVNFTGGVEGTGGGGSLPDPWTNSIALTGAKTFSVTPTVAGTLTNVGIDNSIIGATTPTTGTFTTVSITGATFMELEGANPDLNELFLKLDDPTSDRFITFPDATGSVALIQPATLDKLTMTTGQLVPSNIFGVGNSLHVDGPALAASAVDRAILFGFSASVENYAPSVSITDSVVLGSSSSVKAFELVGGTLGDITNSFIVATGSSIVHRESTGTMDNNGIIGGGGHLIQQVGAGNLDTSTFTSNTILGGIGCSMQSFSTTGVMHHTTIVGGEGNTVQIQNTGNIYNGLVGGGFQNSIITAASGYNSGSAIVGGSSNTVRTTGVLPATGFIAGSWNSIIQDSRWAAIIGGKDHISGSAASAHYSVIVGGDTHRMGSGSSALYSVIVGGQGNFMGTGGTSITSVVLGGTGNTAQNTGSVVMGNGATSATDYEFRTSGHMYALGYNPPSDSRLKQNISDLDPASALSIMMDLQARNYTYHPSFARGKNVPASLFVAGFIAQEVEGIIDGAVQTSAGASQIYHSAKWIPPVLNETTGEVVTPAHYPPDDIVLNVTDQKSLDSTRLIPYTVAAIQQLKINADTGAFTTLSASTSLTLSDGVDVDVGTTTGTKIGTSAAQKLGFYGATPVAQGSASGSTAGISIGTGTAMNDDTCSTASIGTTCYTLTDLVKIMKDAGLAAL